MILVCSAWEEETKYLDLCQDKFKIIQLGIGYLQAALNLQRFLLRDGEAENGTVRQTSILTGGYLPRIEKIYFIGTAGLISEADINWDMPVFSVNKVSLSLPLSLRKQAYVPKTYPEFSLKTSTELNVADCLSALEITTSSEISSEIEYRPLLENMELYGVAQVAEEFNIPCSAILGVTNRTDASAHQDWISNHKKVSKILCKYFSELAQG
jgi:hypothetical protein